MTFTFSDVSESRREYNTQSIAVGDRVQDEDLGICEDVQRGLKSRALRRRGVLGVAARRVSNCSIVCWRPT